MKKLYAEIHSNMLAEIDHCRSQGFSEKERAEKCFWIARTYRDKLKELATKTGFENNSEEIDFFRNVKPQFVCYIEYFVRLSEALSFASEQRDNAIEFWKEERDRFKRFCKKNSFFIHYYESGEHKYDEKYFLRVNNDLRCVEAASIYDTDIGFYTSHDRLVSDYLAHKMYMEYIKEKLAVLGESSFIGDTEKNNEVR